MGRGFLCQDVNREQPQMSDITCNNFALDTGADNKAYLNFCMALQNYIPKK